MRFTTKTKMLLALVLISVSTLSGCMFYAKMPDGQIAQLNVSSHEIFRFMKQIDDITAEMIKEANFRGHRTLGKTITEFRVVTFELRRKSYGSHALALDMPTLERKFTAFDQQIRASVKENPNAPGAQAIYGLSHKLKYEVMRFKKLLQNSVH